MQDQPIVLTNIDFFRLNSLIDLKVSDPISAHELKNLSDELERAHILEASLVPQDLVTMHSRIQYLNFEDNKTAEITIVFPHEANSDEGKISVTAPIGAALIGLREYDEIEWTFPNGKRKRLKVLDIIYQPEND